LPLPDGHHLSKGRGSCEQVSGTKHFVYLPAERLYRILSDDNLNVTSEMEVFCALLQWLDFDREDRMCMAPKLLQCCVRLQFIPPEQLITKVEPVDWLFENPDCEFLVNEAIRSVSVHSCLIAQARGVQLAKGVQGHGSPLLG